MKVVLINGSPRKEGCTYTGLCIIKEQLANNMAYLIKCKKAANIAEPEEPPRVMTNFIR